MRNVHCRVRLASLAVKFGILLTMSMVLQSCHFFVFVSCQQCYLISYLLVSLGELNISIV